ncbi:MAG: hypothetical protein NVS9B15_22730 [Acidobacteriaceae bacterium]
MEPRTLVGVAGSLLACALVGPLFHPFGAVSRKMDAAAPIFAGTQMPDDVRHTFETKCADCHSQRTHWPLYSHVAPVSWLLESDSSQARQHLDASEWQSYSAETRIDLLAGLSREARTAAMPPRQYTFIHRDAKLTLQEIERLSLWARSERTRLKTLEGD